MKWKFLGTRGNIKESSDTHKYHSANLLEDGNVKILIDFGEEHPSFPEGVDAVVVSHAHPDHFKGLFDVKDLPPVYAHKKVIADLKQAGLKSKKEEEGE